MCRHRVSQIERGSRCTSCPVSCFSRLWLSSHFISYYLSLLHWVSTNVILSGECLAILETMSAVTLYWQLGRLQRCCGTSHNAQGSSHNAQGNLHSCREKKNYSLKNVNSAEVEKPLPCSPRGPPLCRYKISENHFSWRVRIHIYIYLNHFAIHKKWTQLCKSTTI